MSFNIFHLNNILFYFIFNFIFIVSLSLVIIVCRAHMQYNESKSLVIFLIFMLTYCLLELKVHRHMHMIELGYLTFVPQMNYMEIFNVQNPKNINKLKNKLKKFIYLFKKILENN